MSVLFKIHFAEPTRVSLRMAPKGSNHSSQGGHPVEMFFGKTAAACAIMGLLLIILVLAALCCIFGIFWPDQPPRADVEAAREEGESQPQDSSPRLITSTVAGSPLGDTGRTFPCLQITWREHFHQAFHGNLVEEEYLATGFGGIVRAGQLAELRSRSCKLGPWTTFKPSLSQVLELQLAHVTIYMK